jgi:flagellar biosynthesis protein FliQ
MTPETVVTIGATRSSHTLLLRRRCCWCAGRSGLLVGMFQAATQINEMTLSFIPKLLGAGGDARVAGHWMLQADRGVHADAVHQHPGADRLTHARDRPSRQDSSRHGSRTRSGRSSASAPA